MLYLDAEDRLWFVTPGNVGFYQITRQTSVGNPAIPITTFTIPTAAPQPGAIPLPQITPAVSFSEVQETPLPYPLQPVCRYPECDRKLLRAAPAPLSLPSLSGLPLDAELVQAETGRSSR